MADSRWSSGMLILGKATSGPPWSDWPAVWKLD
jgi:hypothetical protein